MNGHLEPWDFGHPGWVNERLSVHVVSPVKDTLDFEVLAWTPGTDGTVTRAGVSTNRCRRSRRKDELTTYLDDSSARSRARSCWSASPRGAGDTSTPPPSARQDDERARAVRSGQPAAGSDGGGGRGRGDRRRLPRRPMTTAEVNRTVDQFLVATRPLRINDAGREHGQIRAFNNRTFDVAKAMPTVVMRNEDYGRISRILADGTPVELEFNIVNRSFPEGKTAYNTIAEIPGTRQERRSRDARRPSRLVALGDRRHRQRDRLRGDDGSGADPAGDRRASRAARFASRCGAAKNRACSDRRPT